MNDEPIGELDQFHAFARDLLASNGLELVETTNLDEAWIDAHSGRELLDALIETASRAGADGRLQPSWRPGSRWIGPVGLRPDGLPAEGNRVNRPGCESPAAGQAREDLRGYGPRVFGAPRLCWRTLVLTHTGPR